MTTTHDWYNPAAVKEIKKLVSQHQLGYYFNPGGVAFYTPDGRRLQVSGIDDAQDLADLQRWLDTSLRDAIITGFSES